MILFLTILIVGLITTLEIKAVHVWMEFCINKMFTTGRTGLWEALGIGIPVMFLFTTIALIITITPMVVKL